MKNLLSSLVLVGLVFSLGVICGAMLQRRFDLERLLNIARIEKRPSSAPMRQPSRMPTHVYTEIPEEFRGKLSLYILAGQSNMSGRGELPFEQSVHPRVFVFGNDYRWHVAIEPIDAPDGQVDEVSRDGDAGFGPGLTFATALAQHNPDVVIGLIPCAKGASSIEQWQRNLSENSLYGSCLKRVRAASTMGTVVALLFFQGEADAVDPKRALNYSPSAFTYAMKFSTFVNDFRGDVSFPNMPIIFAQIGTTAAPNVFLNWTTVKEQQTMTDLSCSAIIITDDLALRDEVHFTTESYEIIGKRYAEALVQLKTARAHCK